MRIIQQFNNCTMHQLSKNFEVKLSSNISSIGESRHIRLLILSLSLILSLCSSSLTAAESGSVTALEDTLSTGYLPDIAGSLRTSYWNIANDPNRTKAPGVVELWLKAASLLGDNGKLVFDGWGALIDSGADIFAKNHSGISVLEMNQTRKMASILKQHSKNWKNHGHSIASSTNVVKPSEMSF